MTAKEMPKSKQDALNGYEFALEYVGNFLRELNLKST
jgi:hypothetical protein